ncbi:MAG: hypothetical protein KDD04_07330 [Sinomicrobium sp.]|nr:hypothetical protein [Sinomicrobium sp.]
MKLPPGKKGDIYTKGTGDDLWRSIPKGVFEIKGNLAILISYLGLFGLTSFVAEQRTKEIGIRNVVGASVLGIWKMLFKDFVVLVIISCGITIPIAYYFLGDWLSK